MRGLGSEMRAPPCFVDLREVVIEQLHDAALILYLLLQLIEMLEHQVTERVRWLVLERQHAAGSEDPKQHLHAVTYLLRPFAPAPMPRSTHRGTYSFRSR